MGTILKNKAQEKINNSRNLMYINCHTQNLKLDKV